MRVQNQNDTILRDKYTGPSVWGMTGYIALVLAFTGMVSWILRLYPFLEERWIWSNGILLVATLLAWMPFRSVGVVCDLMVMVFMMGWLFGGIGPENAALHFFPLLVAVWVTTAFAVGRFWTVPVVWSAAIIWLSLHGSLNWSDFDFRHWMLLASGAAMLLLFTLDAWPGRRKAIRSLDLVVCSYSGHTARFADLFAQGAARSGAAVRLHRFHYHRTFHADLHADALVVAFPIIGCKPPWSFLYYLCFRLPPGNGKPAFILYTCIGGAENAGVLCWLILALKGYRVAGRNWTLYPLNVPTFRLGPKTFWRWMDSLVPTRAEDANQVRCGGQFANGKPAGIPWVFALTPAVLFGILLDNKWLDTILYRNHTFRKRCTGCGVCVKYCPAQRLRMVDGYPKPKGTCNLCMGCVNICPTHAMHLWFWTEYGRQYTPRWRPFVVKSGPPGHGADLDSARGSGESSS